MGRCLGLGAWMQAWRAGMQADRTTLDMECMPCCKLRITP